MASSVCVTAGVACRRLLRQRTSVRVKVDQKGMQHYSFNFLGRLPCVLSSLTLSPKSCMSPGVCRRVRQLTICEEAKSSIPTTEDACHLLEVGFALRRLHSYR